MRSLQANAGLGLLLAVTLLGGPVVAEAQRFGGAPEESVPGSPSHEARTFGTTALVSHTIQAYAFTGFAAASSAAFDANGFKSRFCSVANCAFEAPVFLPAGALVTAIELEACDTNPAARVVATFRRIGALESSVDPSLAIVSTGTSATPGCNFFSQALSPTHTIDNVNNTYVMRVFISGTDSTTRFQAVRIFYHLQVSPAPAPATFTDVPTSHIFFRFVEALAAAGITTGCNASPPLYCPDPLRRGIEPTATGKGYAGHRAHGFLDELAPGGHPLG